MPFLLSENIKTLIAKGIVSALITGAFTFFVFSNNLLTFIFGMLIGGQVYLYVALFEEILRPRLNKQSFLPALFTSTLIYILIIIFAVFLSIIIINRFDLSLFLQGHFREFLFSRAMLWGLIFGLLMSLFFNAYSIFDTLLGKNFLLKIFTGKYHRPFEEERIFMFLDIKSSTTIAEKLGHKQFLLLLNDFFFDLAEPVMSTHGEIYKYVGDEAIITWKMKAGIKYQGPLRCYFRMKERLELNSGRYLKKYGFVPQFKAGVHGGVVVTGEMGFIKKEITYLGDVLNTTSRIEAACNEFGKTLILSDDILQKLNPGDDYIIQHLGHIRFRGKEIPVGISSVENNLPQINT
jgi:adenylate cyclase